MTSPTAAMLFIGDRGRASSTTDGSRESERPIQARRRAKQGEAVRGEKEEDRQRPDQQQAIDPIDRRDPAGLGPCILHCHRA